LIDIATIGLAVDTKDVKNAARDLDNLTKAGDKASHSADGMGKSYKAAGVMIGLAAAGAVVGLVGLVKKSIDLADANSKAAQQVGVHIEKLTALQHAANLAGVNSKQLNDGLLRFSKTISEAQQGTKSAVSVFADLGIQLQNNDGQLKTTDNLLLEVAESFSGYADGATKTAAAQELFGRSGAQLIPLLNQGSKGIEEMMKQAEALGLVMDQKTATAAENFNDSLTVLQSSFSGVINRVTQQLTPTLVELTGMFLEVAQDTSTATTAAEVLGNVLKGLVSIGIAVASAFNTVGTALGGMIAAQMAILRGDFKGAWGILKDTATDASASVEKAVNRINKLWSGDYKDAGNTAIAVSNALGDAKKQLVRTIDSESSATANAAKEQEDYNIKLMEQIADIRVVNELIKSGMDIDEARLRVAETRKGALNENIELLIKEQTIQKDILQIEIDRVETTRRWLASQQKIATENFRKAQSQLQEMTREQKRTSDEFSRSLTDAIFRGFEAGKSFAENFKQALINSFRTLILQPLVRFVVDSSGITGVLGSIGSSLTGGGGGFGSLLGGFKDIIGSLNGSLVSSIESLGVFLSTGTGGLGDMLGGFIGQYSAQIANVLPYAGAALQLLSGDAKGAAFTAAGAAIGSVFPVIGTALGGAIGALVGSLFGGKDYKRFGTTVSGTSTADGYRKTGQGIIYDRPIAAAAGPLNDLNKSFSDTVQALFAAFDIESTLNTSSGVYQRGKSKKSGGVFNASVDGQSIGGLEVVLKKADMQQVYAALVDKVFGEGLVKVIQASSLSDGIKKFFDGLTKKEDVAAAIQTLMTLNLALKDLPPVFDAIKHAIDTTAYKTSIPQLQQNFANLATFTSLFYTEAENFATFTKQLTTQFDNLNVGLPATAQAFRELVESINVVDEATSNQFNSLVALAPAAKQYYDYLEQQRKSLEDLNRAAANNLNRGLFSTSADFASAQANIAIGGSGSEFYAGYRNQSETTIALLEEIKMLRKDNADMKITMEAVAKYTYDTAKIQRQWNGDGLPAERVI